MSPSNASGTQTGVQEQQTAAADQSATDDSTATTANSSAATTDFQYVLVYEGMSVAHTENLDEPWSLGAQLGMSRVGGSTFEFEPDTVAAAIEAETGVGEGQIEDADWEPQDILSHHFLGFDTDDVESRLDSETDYFMRFVPSDFTRCTVNDILALPTLNSYPLPQSAYDGLDSILKQELSNDGRVRFTAKYMPSEGRFFGVNPGWDVTGDDRDEHKMLFDLLEQCNSAKLATDVFFVREMGFDPSIVGQARGVSERAVSKNLAEFERRDR